MKVFFKLGKQPIFIALIDNCSEYFIEKLSKDVKKQPNLRNTHIKD